MAEKINVVPWSNGWILFDIFSLRDSVVRAGVLHGETISEVHGYSFNR